MEREFEKPGFLSERQFQEHLKLYRGYLKKVDEIRQGFREANLKDANATQSAVRDLILGETFAANGARLHEYYFENLAKGVTEPSGKALQAIEEKWGSFDKFKERLMAFALSVRGWVVLAQDSYAKRLRMFGTDKHDTAVWLSSPLLVLDVYEHAYFIDFGTDRKGYVEAFLQNINWDAVSKRLLSK